MPFLIALLATAAANYAHATVNNSNLTRCEISMQSESAGFAQIQTGLAHFPTETITDSDPGEKIWEEKVGKFWQAMTRSIKGYRWYGISQLTGGYDFPFELSQLIGKVVAGYASPFLIYKDGEQPLSVFFAGTIRAIKHIAWLGPSGRSVEVTIETITGKTSTLPTQLDVSNSHNYKFYILGEDAPINDIIAQTIETSGLNELLTRQLAGAFTHSNLETIIDILTLYKELPATHGVTAIVNTLRGTKDINKNRPEYGKLNGRKDYSAFLLTSLAKQLEDFLHKQHATIWLPLPVNEKGRKLAPEWIAAKKCNPEVIAGVIAYYTKLKAELPASDSPALLDANEGTKKTLPLTAKAINKKAQEYINAAWNVQSYELALLNLRDLAARRATTAEIRNFDYKNVEVKRVKALGKKDSGSRVLEYSLAVPHLDVDARAIGVKYDELDKLYSFMPMATITIADDGSRVKGPEFFWRKMLPFESIAKSLGDIPISSDIDIELLFRAEQEPPQ